ncbi:hypothetical protein M422DRAFT_782348 [Sphaerobolus stellatus SS14]|uniref:F-box domain-containing protein n=1 Tax=Sphaerobolus stellatus (strain SS14) TaxID=990650 RepID=A0A0C9VEY7_SPHS4|nr:hypothetical protein M422DRAFT_782348 [Sphaerobolus stellatus SS14]
MGVVAAMTLEFEDVLPFAGVDDAELNTELEPHLLQRLPPELLYMIFKILAERRSKSFEYNLRLVSKHINHITTPVLYHSVILPEYYSPWRLTSPLHRMILGAIAGSFSHPWTYTKSLYTLGEEPCFAVIIRRGYCSNLKTLIMTHLSSMFGDVDEYPSNNKLSEVLLINLEHNGLSFHQTRGRISAAFTHVTHFFLGELYPGGYLEPTVSFFKQLPALTHLGIPSQVCGYLDERGFISTGSFVELSLQSLRNLKVLMVYLQWSYSPEVLYHIALREWDTLQRVTDGRLIVRDDIRKSDVVRCFYEERSIWDNVWKWEDWRNMDEPPRYRCRGKV